MIDVSGQINAVQRRLGKREIAAGAAIVGTITQTYDSDIEDVWDACTNPERLPRWFLPVTGDLRLHGRYQLEGNAGGTIERCDPPHSFSATWEFAEAVSWIEVRLTAVSDERTKLELDHIAMPSAHWDEFGPGATGIGWDLGLLGLALYLGRGAAMDPATAEAWSASPEGQEFARLSGERWYEADLAFGSDQGPARKRADKTIAFYTGVPQES